VYIPKILLGLHRIAVAQPLWICVFVFAKNKRNFAAKPWNSLWCERDRQIQREREGTTNDCC